MIREKLCSLKSAVGVTMLAAYGRERTVLRHLDLGKPSVEEVADIVLENDAEYSTKYRAIAEFKGVVS